MTKTKNSVDILDQSRNWILWLPLILSLILYANTFNHQFALDDYSVILEHSHVQKGIAGISDLMTTNYRHGQQGFNDGLYRPLSLVSFALEKSWFNSKPSISHLINILLYAFSIFILWRALINIFSENLLLPFGIILLFLSHPLHTEVVANIKGRDELLAFFGFAICLYSFMKSKEGVHYWILGLIGFTIALFSKESAVVFCFFIPAIMLFDHQKKVKDVLPHLAALLPLVILFILWRNHILDSMENPVDEGNFGLLNNPIAASNDSSLKWGSTFALQWMFLSKLFLPITLIHDYSFDSIGLSKLTSFKSIFGIFCYLGLVYLGILAFLKKNKWGIIAILYSLSIAVASQILIPIGVQFAERMLFVAVLPFSILIVFLLRDLIGKKNRNLSTVQQKTILFALIGITTLFSLKTISRNADWENNYTLYKADIEKGSRSARVNYNYGTTLSELSDQSSAPQKTQLLNEAVVYLQRAVNIYPNYLDAWNNLGIAYKKQGNYQAAVQLYEANIKRDPSYTKNYFNLGTAYFQLGENRKAIRALEEYTSRKPNSPDAYMIMAQAAGKEGSFGEAISLLNAYLQYQPRDANAFNMLGMAYGSLDQFIKAESAFQKASQIEPGRTDILLNRAVNFNRQGDKVREEKVLRKIIALQPQHQVAVRQLISLLESSGRIEEAANYRSALK